MLAPLALAVHLFGAPSVIDWAVGAHSEVAAGSIPVTVDDSYSPAAEAFFELHTGLRVSAPTYTLTLRYAPRLFGRLPGTEQLGRPLLYNTLSLGSVARPSERWTVGLNASGGLGEVAYSGIRELFPAGTGVVPVSTLSLMTGNAEAFSSYRSTRQSTVRLALNTAGQAPLDEADPVPTYGSLGAAIGDEYRLSRRNTLSLTSHGTYFVSDDQGDILALGADAGFLRRVDHTSTVRLQVGAVGTQSPEHRVTMLPTGSVSYGTSWGSRTRTYGVQLAGGTQGFFDELSFEYRPVAFLSSEVTATGASLRSALNLSATTSLTSRPADDLPFETIVSLALPSSYVLTERFDLLFGARGSLYAPHLSELAEGRRQAQFLVYVGFRHHDGTAPSRGNWLN